VSLEGDIIFHAFLNLSEHSLFRRIIGILLILPEGFKLVELGLKDGDRFLESFMVLQIAYFLLKSFEVALFPLEYFLLFFSFPLQSISSASLFWDENLSNVKEMKP